MVSSSSDSRKVVFRMSTIYVHWPFCLSKCRYCDFYSVPQEADTDYKMWLDKYQSALSRMAASYYDGDDITSIYFGGGTPSLLPARFVDGLIAAARQSFRLSDDVEITLEANPRTISLQHAVELRRCGVNRISIGAQSIVDSDLETLGRTHTSSQAVECVYDVCSVFENVSIDMIYNRPAQTLDGWIRELNVALKLPVTHVSLYELIVENNTEISRLIETGVLPPPSDSPEFFERTVDTATENDFEMYEVSNFARDRQYRCRHSLSYWTYQDYYGVGPGAHSRVTKGNQKIAIAQVCNINKWISWSGAPHFEEEELSKDDVYKEIIIMGLRSKIGVDLQAIDAHTKAKYGLKNKLKKLLESDYATLDGRYVALTRSGILRLNLIARYLTDLGGV
ncbi:MAG: radical SAM family heme chaperone HemW [Holosporales bacterium]|jgi:oxygen-independent coproporphyrinogen-3 oxidase|nr:radical SAM family heme chaperone HemW [Holosporales bacterium]